MCGKSALMELITIRKAIWVTFQSYLQGVTLEFLRSMLRLQSIGIYKILNNK